MFTRKMQSLRSAHLMLVWIWMLAFLPIGKLVAQAQSVPQSQAKYTSNTPDLNKRSVIEVDPTTLALNITIPLGSYPGRNGGLPITLHYNSKLWRVQPYVCSDQGSVRNEKHTIHYETGWTSSLQVPYIDYSGADERYIVRFRDGITYYGPDHGQPAGRCPVVNLLTCADGCYAYPWLYYIDRLRLKMPGGSSHELRAGDSATPYPVGPIYKAVDGSGTTYDRSIQTVYLPDGSQYRLNTPTGAEYVDRNGNKLIWNRDAQRWTDTLGRTFTEPLAASSEWSLPGQGGSELGYTFTRGLLRDDNTGQTLLTNPQNPADPLPWNPGVGQNPLLYAAPRNEFSGQYLGDSLFSFESNEENHNNLLVQFGHNRHNPYLIHQIALPNNQKYIFTYNIYGEIDKVILPTGGYKRYRYDYVPPSTFASTPDMYTQTNRGVVEMWESEKGDGTDERHWRFTESVNGEVIFKITAPDGTYVIKDIYQSAPPNNSFGFAVDGGDARAGRINRETSYDAAGNKLSMKVYDWTYDNTGPARPPYVSPGQPIGIQQASRNPRLVAETDYLYKADGNMVVRRITYQHDNYLNVIATTQHAEVTVSQGTTQLPSPIPVRTVETTYLVNDPDIPPSRQAEYRERNLIRLVTKTLVRDNSAGVVVAATQIVYDEYTPQQYGAITSWEAPRINADGNLTTAYGNVTTVRRWQDYTYDAMGAGSRQTWNNWTTGTWLNTHSWYDQCGNVVRTRDANLKDTTFGYIDNFDNHPAQDSYAYPTRITDPLSFTTNTKYDFHTGLVMEVTDPNSIKTRNEYNDPFNRLTKTIRAEGTSAQGQTVIQYEDAQRQVITTSDKDNFAESSSGYGLRSVVFYDGLGRTTRNAVYEGLIQGNNSWSVNDTVYDALHRVAAVSNHYRITAANVSDIPDAANTASKDWTTTHYDALSRVIAVTAPDGAVVSTAYDGTRVLVTDQAGKQRLSQSNALGHLTDVWEIAPADGATEAIAAFPGYPTMAGYHTRYLYDALDNLTSVTQYNRPTNTTQTRSFVYDSLKRLVAATNPESGRVRYRYDANGNLTHKTDALGTKTIIGYDALNRATSKRYSDGTPTVSYYYDHNQTPPSGLPANFNRGSAQGRLVAVTYDGAGSGSYYSYDELGRARQSVQRTLGQDYGLSYAYNRAGQVTSETYPSERVVRTSYDPAGRPSLVRGQQTGEPTRDYAAQFSYAAHGAVKEMRLGNGLWEQMQFNNRLQVTQIGLGTVSGNTSVLQLDYKYNDDEVANNNGNVLRQTITVPGLSLVQKYKYDALNRLIEAKESDGASWQQTYDYDRYGNRVVREGSYFPRWHLTPKYLTSNYDAATNRLSEPYWQHDAAGNQTRDAGGQNFAYDAEHRLIRVSTDQGEVNGSYSYDGEGRRVQKVAGGVTTVFVYNAAGQLIAEYTNTAAGVEGTKYLTGDTLGGTRVVSGGQGEVRARYDYLPFGEELTAGIGGRMTAQGYSGRDNTRQKFVGYERDDETGLDFAQARYCSTAQGRFTSVDPLLSSAILYDPQSWNRYSYVGNRPLVYTDPNGLQWGRNKESGAYQWFASSVVDEGWEKISIGTEYNSVNGQVILLAGGNWNYVRQPQAGINVFADTELTNSLMKLWGLSVLYGASLGGGAFYGSVATSDLFALSAQIASETAGAGQTGGVAALTIKSEGFIDPNQVRFSQDSASYKFSDGRTIDDTANGLRSGSINGSDIPAIRLVEREGVLYTLDNRRLEAFRRAGVRVPYRIATPEEAAKQGWKFTTKNGGTSIRIRVK